MIYFNKSRRHVYEFRIIYEHGDKDAKTMINYDGRLIHVSIRDEFNGNLYLNVFRDGGYRWCNRWNESDKYVFPDGMIETIER